MRISVSASEPVRPNQAWEERWEGADHGLIACWERGREKAEEDPTLAQRAKAGELVVLPWKGGVERGIKGIKYGTYFYLAMWQGLRGEDLDIDPDLEIALKCAASGVRVVFTNALAKYGSA